MDNIRSIVQLLRFAEPAQKIHEIFTLP